MTRTPILRLLPLLLLLPACVTSGDPEVIVRVDLERERLMLQSVELVRGLVDRVDNWTPAERAEITGPAESWLEAYRELADRERDYLEATGAPAWEDVARTVGGIGRDLIVGEEGATDGS